MQTPKDAPILTQLLSNIVPTVIIVLKLTQSAAGVATPQAKQALLQATNDLKSTLAQAKDCAATLPGGELNFQEQEDLIFMLEKLRAHKWQELVYFAHHATNDASHIIQAANTNMEVDSTASTPFGS